MSLINNSSLDDYFSKTAIGSIDRAIGNNLYGINHRQTAPMVPNNKDLYGYTFFVRPQLNMQDDNIRNIRLFYPLLTKLDTSIQRFVRTTLDPRLMTGYRFKGGSVAPMSCPIVDNENAFIPVLSNNLLSVSGWPDVVAPTYTSERGLYNEAWSIVDGITRYYESFNLECTWRNTRGDPILYLFYIWMNYQSFLFEGKMVPYLDYLADNVIDYNTRIYRLIMDPYKDRVTKIANTGVAFPESVPIGSMFDFNHETPYSEANKEITIRFKCLGAEYLDDVSIHEFNQTVNMFNAAMSPNQAIRESGMVKINKSILTSFNFRGYPRINENTYELEWWVPKTIVADRIDQFLLDNEELDLEEIGE